MSIGGSEKFQYIPQDLENPVHTECDMHAQERPEKALSSLLWLISRLRASRKWLEQKSVLLSSVLHSLLSTGPFSKDCR